MAKKGTSKPKSGPSTKIIHGNNGGTTFVTSTQTGKGMKRVIYDVPPKPKQS